MYCPLVRSAEARNFKMNRRQLKVRCQWWTSGHLLSGFRTTKVYTLQRIRSAGEAA
jgi:hypothetical protein